MDLGLKERGLFAILLYAVIIGAVVWIVVKLVSNKQNYTSTKDHDNFYSSPESYSDIACLYKNNPACSSDPDCCRNPYPRCGAYYGSKSCCS